MVSMLTEVKNAPPADTLRVALPNLGAELAAGGLAVSSTIRALVIINRAKLKVERFIDFSP